MISFHSQKLSQGIRNIISTLFQMKLRLREVMCLSSNRVMTAESDSCCQTVKEICRPFCALDQLVDAEKVYRALWLLSA